MIQGLYNQYVCPHLINWAMQAKPISKQRKKIIPKAIGRVLEIGIGSGLNFKYYNQSKVSEVFAVEPDSILLNKAKINAQKTTICIQKTLVVAHNVFCKLLLASNSNPLHFVFCLK